MYMCNYSENANFINIRYNIMVYVHRFASTYIHIQFTTKSYWCIVVWLYCANVCKLDQVKSV